MVFSRILDPSTARNIPVLRRNATFFDRDGTDYAVTTGFAIEFRGRGSAVVDIAVCTGCQKKSQRLASSWSSMAVVVFELPVFWEY